jgi:hypothetical protein
LALGFWDVDALLAEIPAWKLAEWMAYAELEPFGEGRADLRAGMLASVMANANRDSEEQPEPFQPGDFFENLNEGEEPEADEPDWMRIKRAMQMLVEEQP